VLNEKFHKDLKEHLSPGMSVDDATFISIDATGADVRVRNGHDFSVERIGFDARVQNVDEAIAAVQGVLVG
jgi:hypothetical protein